MRIVGLALEKNPDLAGRKRLFRDRQFNLFGGILIERPVSFSPNVIRTLLREYI